MLFSEYKELKAFKERRYSVFVILFLILFQCAVISGFSAQAADSSSKLSENTGRILFKLFSFLFGSYDEAKFEIFHIVLRKAAHFYNFALVGTLVFCLCRLVEKDEKSTFLILFSGVLAAACDEFHQYFVPGRSAQVSDVLIDFSGVLFGAAVLYLLFWLVFRKIHIKEKLKI